MAGRRSGSANRRSADPETSGDSEATGKSGGTGKIGDKKSGAKPEDPVAKAKERCLVLLTSRPRSRAELAAALAKHDTDPDVAERVLSRFGEVGLIDDRAFSEQWVRSRHNHAGLARRALVSELRRKGVDPSVAAEAAEAVDPESEEQRARELVRRKLRSVYGKDETTVIRRLVGVLARKGYPEGLAYRVVREELAAAGEESSLLDDAVPE